MLVQLVTDVKAKLIIWRERKDVEVEKKISYHSDPISRTRRRTTGEKKTFISKVSCDVSDAERTAMKIVHFFVGDRKKSFALAANNQREKGGM